MDALVTTSRVIHLPSMFAIRVQDGGCLLPADIAHDLDATLVQLTHPLLGLGTFIKPNRPGIRVPRTTDQSLDPRPRHGTEAHGTWLCARDELTLAPCGTQIIVSKSLLRQR
jgi:hypothetical protein